MPRHPETGGTLPMTPDREWDMPSGPHLGPPAALNVPISERDGPREFDRGFAEEDALVGAEPELEAWRQMEAGADWTPKAERRVHELDRPIAPSE